MNGVHCQDTMVRMGEGRVLADEVQRRETEQADEPFSRP